MPPPCDLRKKGAGPRAGRYGIKLDSLRKCQVLTSMMPPVMMHLLVGAIGAVPATSRHTLGTSGAVVPSTLLRRGLRLAVISSFHRFRASPRQLAPSSQFDDSPPRRDSPEVRLARKPLNFLWTICLAFVILKNLSVTAR